MHLSTRKIVYSIFILVLLGFGVFFANPTVYYRIVDNVKSTVFKGQDYEAPSGYFKTKQAVRLKDMVKAEFNDEGAKYKYYESFDCAEVTQLAKNRCVELGGEFTRKLSSVGIGLFYTSGCYRTGNTIDAKKFCKTDGDCQGMCIWVGGDIGLSDGEDKYHQCTDYRKPFFLFGKISLCDEYLNSGAGYSIKDSGWDKEMEADYVLKIQKLLAPYWKTGKSSGIWIELNDFVVPPKYEDLHFGLFHIFYWLEHKDKPYMAMNRPDNQTIVSQQIESLKIKYPWIVSSLIK